MMYFMQLGQHLLVFKKKIYVLLKLTSVICYLILIDHISSTLGMCTNF